MNTKELDKKYIANTYARADVVFTHGKGATIYDDQNNEYIDLGAGIAVNAFGCADDEWIDAVTEQLHKLQHISNLYYTEPCARLAQLLCEKTGLKRVFFGNSGAEANECAIKTARKWAFDKYGDSSHSTIITLKNSFHGRTITTLAATGQEQFHQIFDPFTEGFVYATPEDAEELEMLAGSGNVCAIMIELVQGEGGVVTISREYIDKVVEIAKKHDLLIIDDEVQTGNGRTGTLYAYMQYGFVPDIVTTAKGLGGGLPLGACMMGEKTENTLTPGTHGSTFGGNPVSCAGAISVISRIDDKLLGEVNDKAKYIRDELQSVDGIKNISGLGLMIGLECEKPASKVAAELLEKGVIVLTAHEKVRLVPPLNITMEELSKAIEKIKEVVSQ